MSGMTVSQLYKYCGEQIMKGNGNKTVCISNDDEGNGFHTLFYQFFDDGDEIKEYADAGMLHDDNNPSEIILLG